MVECSWTPSVTVPITSSWPQGEYLFKLMADPGQQSYIPLTVRDLSSHATYVIQSSVLTWQAWNDYGGYSNFGGLAARGSAPSFNDRARVLSFDRPYAKGFGSSDFLGLEFPLISYAEQHGLDVSYWTDIDFSQNPQLLTNHKALLSLGHNEFITSQERQGEVDGLQHGVNLAFLGATPDLRPARLQASPLGPDREEVAYRDAREDPFSRTDPEESTPNTWDQAPLSKPASLIVGDTYGGYGINASLVVAKPAAWPLAGTSLAPGSQLPHVVLGDYDKRADPGPLPRRHLLRPLRKRGHDVLHRRRWQRRGLRHRIDRLDPLPRTVRGHCRRVPGGRRGRHHGQRSPSFRHRAGRARPALGPELGRLLPPLTTLGATDRTTSATCG
jgi:hypothetical protein